MKTPIKVFFFGLIALLYLGSSRGFATGAPTLYVDQNRLPERVKHWPMADQFGYQFATDYCHSDMWFSFQEVFIPNQDQTSDMLLKLNTDQLWARVKMKLASPLYTILLKSGGFREGLDECFGTFGWNSPTSYVQYPKRWVFIVWLALADGASTVTGTAQAGMWMVLGLRAFNLLNRWFVATRFSDKIDKVIPKKWVVPGLSGGSVIASAGYDIYEKQMLRQRTEKQNEAMHQELINDYSDLKKLIAAEKDQEKLKGLLQLKASLEDEAQRYALKLN